MTFERTPKRQYRKTVIEVSHHAVLNLLSIHYDDLGLALLNDLASRSRTTRLNGDFRCGGEVFEIALIPGGQEGTLPGSKLLPG